MSEQNNQLDKFIKAKLHDLDRATPPADWDRMEQKLDGYYARKQRVRRLKLVEVSLLLLLIITLAHFKDWIVPSSDSRIAAQEYTALGAPGSPLQPKHIAFPLSEQSAADIHEQSVLSATSATSEKSNGHETTFPGNTQLYPQKTAPASGPIQHKTELREDDKSHFNLPLTTLAVKSANLLAADGHQSDYVYGIEANPSSIKDKYPWPLLDGVVLGIAENIEAKKMAGKPDLEPKKPEQRFKREFYLLAETGNARMKSFSRTVNHHRFSRASSNVAYSLGAGTQINEHWHIWMKVRYLNGSFMPNSEFDNGIGYDHSGNMHAHFDSAGVNMLSLSVHMLPLLAAGDRASWFFIIGASGHAVTHSGYRRQMVASNKPEDASPGTVSGLNMDDVGLFEGGNLKANLFPTLDFGTVITYSIAPTVTVYLNPILFYPLDGIGQGNDLVFVSQWMIGARLNLR